MKELLKTFFQEIENGKVEVYNEFSLQHELGIFLRSHMKSYKVQFERNSSFFGLNTHTKHEIDISIFNDNEKKCAIELKFPRRGQYPEQMFSFVKDIAFLEELKGKNGFQKCYAVTLVDDKNFYESRVTLPKGSIYSFFRNGKAINGTITKPTGAKDVSYNIAGTYKVNWINIGVPAGTGDAWKYYIIEC